MHLLKKISVYKLFIPYLILILLFSAYSDFIDSKWFELNYDIKNTIDWSIDNQNDFQLALEGNNYYQVTDSIAAYFPLKKGNAFYYRRIHDNPGIADTSYLVSRITDTNIFNGKTYYYCTNFLGDLNRNYYLRFNADSGMLVYYDSISSGCNYEYKLYHLNASIGDSLGGRPCVSNLNYKCIDIFDTTLFGNVFPSKRFQYWNYGQWSMTNNHTFFGRGLGSYYVSRNTSTSHSFQATYINLVGAFIDGIIYGDTNINITQYFTVSGQVRYFDNNQPVDSGYVKAFKYYPSINQIIAIDSAPIGANGIYTLNECPTDSLDIMAYADDELDFIPTYHYSTTDWRASQTIYPTSNLNNIDIDVQRINNSGQYSLKIKGRVYCSGDAAPINLNDAYIYARNINYYRNYAISDFDGQYTIDSLPQGMYILTANRMGYNPVTRYVFLWNSNRDSINFNMGNLVGNTGQENLFPSIYKLYQNYPNPFNPTTKIKFSLPSPSKGGVHAVKLIIYDVLGREVTALVNEQLSPGTYEVEWNPGASGPGGSKIPSGVYYYQLTVIDPKYNTVEFRETKKMILIK